MSLNHERATLARLNKEIADCRIKEAGEVKKAADAQKKVNNALDSSRRASSPSSAKMYLSTAERETKALQNAQENQSRHSAQGASKARDAARLHEKISKEEESQRKKAVGEEDKRRRDDETRQKANDDRQKRATAAADDSARAMQRRIRELEAQVAQQLKVQAASTPAFVPVTPEGEDKVFDVFISHAWEDKEDFVDEFAEKAKAAGLNVWYDKFAMQWGDSLRQKIDAGLAGSYFGVAVLSPKFFAKDWPNYELDGLMEKATTGNGRLLPIWHQLTKDDVAKRSPSLAGRLALNTGLMSTSEIVAELVKLRDQYRANVAEQLGSGE